MDIDTPLAFSLRVAVFRHVAGDGVAEESKRRRRFLVGLRGALVMARGGVGRGLAAAGPFLWHCVAGAVAVVAAVGWHGVLVWHGGVVLRGRRKGRGELMLWLGGERGTGSMRSMCRVSCVV